MKIRCIITDDEPIARKGMQSYVEKFPNLELKAVCEDAVAMNQKLHQEKIDLLFLDIEMPLLSGVEWLRTVADPPKVIFTTAYENYAVEGFQLDVLDYLLKPISFERFTRSINKATEYFRLRAAPDAESIFVKVDNRLEQIFIPNVIFLQAMENYVCIQLVGKRVIAHSTLKSMLEKLPSYFVQTHKSWIVNSKMIRSVEGNTIHVDQGEVPVSRYAKDEVMRRILS